MITTNQAQKRARWRVAWVTKGRVITKAFGGDFFEAMKLYTKAKDAGKSGVTLICTNMAFEPPPKYHPHTKRMVKKTRTSRGKIRKEIVELEVDPMAKLNRKGVWWCPFCIKFRQFEQRKGFRVDGVWVPEPGFHCPLCGISHRNNAVRKWNPLARRLFISPPWQRTRSRKTTTTRRRRRA